MSITFNDAVLIIREQLPNRLIWYGIEYLDRYVFSIASDNEYVREDGALALYSVNKKTGSIKNEGLFDLLSYKYKGHAPKRILVDITEDQL